MRRAAALLGLLAMSAAASGCSGTMMTAIREGKTQQVLAAVESKKLTDGCGWCGKGPNVFRTSVVACAALGGQESLVKELIARGFLMDPRCRRSDTWSSVEAAVMGGNASILKLFLDKGAKPDVPGMPPIIQASEKGRADMVRLLLEAGADVDAANVGGKLAKFTGLLSAARGGHAGIIRVILPYCPDAEPEAAHVVPFGGYAHNALAWARKSKNEESVRLLETYAGKAACLKTIKKRKTRAELREIADLEDAGIALAKKKDYRGAIEKFSQALDAAGDSGAEKARARIVKRIFKTAAKSKPPVPKEAKRFAIRGQMLVKEAESQADFAEAAVEFKKVLRAAPWWPEAYFNLALVQEKVGQPASAMSNLKLYLAARPGAKDAAAVERKIIELEFKVERMGR